MRRAVSIILLVLLAISAVAQRGGESVYNFLELTNSARVAALGGKNVSIDDGDLNLVFHNPALLRASMDQQMNLNYVNYFAGVNFGYTSYAFKKEGVGTFAGGIHYVDYGSYDRTDEYGNMHGTFRSSEYAINLLYGRTFFDSVLSVGVNVKPIFSIYEQYTSLGLTADLGVVYTIRATNTTAGFVLKNMGLQITSFSGTRERVPFEIQAGITQGLAHAPFRFSIQLQHLERWDLTYEKKQDEQLIFGPEPATDVRFDEFADKLMRHAIFGVEVLLGEHFHVDLGYNYKRRQEMKMNSWPGMVGFSFGFGFRIKKFHMAYGRSSYHLAGGSNHFSLTTNLSQFYTKGGR